VYISYWECLIFYVEHTEIYMNITKSSVRITISEVLLYMQTVLYIICNQNTIYYKTNEMVVFCYIVNQF